MLRQPWIRVLAYSLCVLPYLAFPPMVEAETAEELKNVLILKIRRIEKIRSTLSMIVTGNFE